MKPSSKKIKEVVPGTADFHSFLKLFHREIGKGLDEKVHSGMHEPGHGSAHMEMTLFYFIKLAGPAGLTIENRDVGALAAILHDVWRENIFFSHMEKSAERAKRILDNGRIINEAGVSLSEEVKKMIVGMVSSHSIQSSRTKTSPVPKDWRLTLLILQAADLLASSGPFGYLRSFSYSGHVLKSMMVRIKTVVTNPKKYQDPLPRNLRRLLSDSGNCFHQWILSIMRRTNRNYREKLTMEAILKLAASTVNSGVDPSILQKTTGLNIDKNKSHEKKMEGGNGPVNTGTITTEKTFSVDLFAMVDEAEKLSSLFEELLNDLDRFSGKGLPGDDAVDDDIVHDVIRLLEYSIPGMCSRAFWGQFNPSETMEDEKYIIEYHTLSERIHRFSILLDEIQEDPAKTGIRTEEGKKILKKVLSQSITLAHDAIEQFQTQRWAPEMWDSLK